MAGLSQNPWRGRGQVGREGGGCGVLGVSLPPTLMVPEFSSGGKRIRHAGAMSEDRPALPG